MCKMTCEPMTDQELALYRAQRALSLWQSQREIATDDDELSRIVYDHLRRRCSTAERLIRPRA